MQFDLFDRGRNDVLSAATYEEFRRRLLASDCKLCPLWEGRTNLVIDRGNPRARIMAIGEAPGENEDLQGLAFVGRAGQLLDEIMKAIGLDTNRDLLIVNVVKDRPPDNRAPTAAEAQACLPYLQKQIELVKPRVILLLGATALKHLQRDKAAASMKDEVGKFFELPEYPGIRFMVLYHPAYLLRDPRKKADMWRHVQTLKRWLDDDAA
jgi:uracil-DNA glycosylase family 4